MDEVIQKPKVNKTKITITITIFVVVIYWLVLSENTTQASIDSSRLKVSTVKEGQFNEYIPIVGSVLSEKTVYLDMQEGGIVDEIAIQAGMPVKKGDLILKLSNASAQKSHVDSESQTLRTLNDLRTQKVNLSKQYLDSKERLLDLKKALLDAERQFKRLSRLHSSQQASISDDEFEQARDSVFYLKEKIALQEERIEHETLLRRQQELQIDDSIVRSNKSLQILSSIINNLEVRAPIDGQLSSMNAEVGQSFSRGQRIGQIDQLDGFKVRADVDQYYISRVNVGQIGRFDFAGQSYEIVIDKIYPEVKDGQFQVDMLFPTAFPNAIKRGQTLQIDLSLGDPSRTKMLKKGGFYRQTQGHWVYKVTGDGSRAYKVNIVPGRQNPQSFEINEGLSAGDKVITSSYDEFGDVDELKLSEPIR